MIFKKKHKIPEPPTARFPGSTEYKPETRAFDPRLKANSDLSELPELPTTKKRIFQNNPIITVNESLPELPSEQEEKPSLKKDKKDKDIFIKIENFKQIVQAIENLQKGLQEAEELMLKLEKMNNQEVSEIDNWRGNIDSLKEQIKTMGENLSP